MLKVIDGDTLKLQVSDRAPIDVRLVDIDAPEICQPWGPEAKKALEEFALGKTAVLQPKARDAWGRTVGVVLVDGESLSKRMVVEGHAWSQRTRWDNGPLVKQERQALALRRGLHTTTGAVMPKDFRRTQGSCAEARTASLATPGTAATSTVAAAAPVVAAAAYRCDGRTHCSQMRSCEEARYFLSHYPRAKMDGDRNGVPCEKQWCAR